MKHPYDKISVLCQKALRLLKSPDAEMRLLAAKDLEMVADAAKMLQISEFRFFQLAYAQWFGTDIPLNVLEHIFADYMFEDVVPHWVRHLTRKVLALNSQGKLDPLDFNIKRPAASFELRSTGLGYTVILAIITIAFCAMIAG